MFEWKKGKFFRTEYESWKPKILMKNHTINETRMYSRIMIWKYLHSSITFGIYFGEQYKSEWGVR